MDLITFWTVLWAKAKLFLYMEMRKGILYLGSCSKTVWNINFKIKILTPFSHLIQRQIQDRYVRLTRLHL
jgi:hypothetical protein